MSSFEKVLHTIRIIYNSMFTLFFSIVTVALLIGGLTGGSAWPLLGVPVFGWLAWFCLGDDIQDVRYVWGQQRPPERP